MPRPKGRKADKTPDPVQHDARDSATPQQETVPRHASPQQRRLKKERRRKQNTTSRDAQFGKEVTVQTSHLEMLLGVLNNLNQEVGRMETVFNPKAWFLEQSPQNGSTTPPLSPPSQPTLEVPESTTPTSTPPPNASFQSAIDALNCGIQLLDQSSQLMRVNTPAIELPPAKRKRGRPPKKAPVASPFFEQPQPLSPPASPPAPLPKTPKKSRSTPKTSPHFETDPFSMQPTPKGLPFELQESGYGLIQERIRGSLYAGVLQTILWNQTTGRAARPVLFKLLCTYPTPESLANADVNDVIELLRCLGLQNRRGERLVKLARMWVDAPPSPERRYAKRRYPHPEDILDIRDGQLLEPDDIRPGWEIAHLPGVGQYALDSYRIFFRDQLRGVKEGNGTEPEWKRVVPLDKDLRPYLVWRWAQDGWLWDPITGERERIIDR